MPQKIILDLEPARHSSKRAHAGRARRIHDAMPLAVKHQADGGCVGRTANVVGQPANPGRRAAPDRQVEDLLGDLRRREVDPAGRPEGRLGRYGPEGQRRAAQLTAVDLPARLHGVAPARWCEADGRLRAPSVLRPPD